jgi:hypothetical protein
MRVLSMWQIGLAHNYTGRKQPSWINSNKSKFMTIIIFIIDWCIYNITCHVIYYVRYDMSLDTCVASLFPPLCQIIRQTDGENIYHRQFVTSLCPACLWTDEESSGSENTIYSSVTGVPLDFSFANGCNSNNLFDICTHTI